MDQETTLRVTLCKLKLLESVTKYARAFVTITFGKLSRSVPNPRFIKNKQANFYRCRLNLTNKTSEKACIKVYGMNSTGYQMEQIASEHIYILSIKENKSFILSNNKVKLQYEVCLLKNGQQQENAEDEIKTEVNLDTQKLSNGISFEPTSKKRASIHKYLSQNRVKTSDDQNTSIHDRSPLLSQQQYKHAHDTLTIYKQDQNKEQSNKMSDQLWINRSQFNFIQPITHTPPRSPRTEGKKKKKIEQYFSLNKKDSNEFQNNKLSKAKQQKSNINNNTQSNSVLYLIISIIAFVLGILVKQNIESD